MEQVQTPQPYYWPRAKSSEVEASLSKWQFASDRAVVELARETAYQVARLLPPSFDGVMPRGYTLKGGDLVMTKMPSSGSLAIPLYGCHSCWSLGESSAFVEDLKTGWLHELASYMRWQLRENAEHSRVFQTALRALRAEF